MTDTIVAKAKGFLLDPAETFRKSGNDEPGTVFLYLGVLLLFNATISAIISAVGMDSMQQYAGISWGAAGAVMVFSWCWLSVLPARSSLLHGFTCGYTFSGDAGESCRP
jgi:hypothetical protein